MPRAVEGGVRQSVASARAIFDTVSSFIAEDDHLRVLLGTLAALSAGLILLNVRRREDSRLHLT